LKQGAAVQVHDPEAMENVRQKYGERVTFCLKAMRAVDGADALAIMTEWGDYQRPEFKEVFRRMRQPVIFDGRNLYEPWAMERLGFIYHSIGRPTVGRAT
jgi:UDPglucose 6-dehydrogenase